MTTVDLALWQSLLVGVDCTVGVTGLSDVLTTEATRQWQRATGVVPSGVPDAATWNIAGEALAYLAQWAPAGRPVLTVGVQGHEPAVRDLQRALNSWGSVLDVNGTFTPKVRQAVRSLQARAGLAESGVVDAATWEALG